MYVYVYIYIICISISISISINDCQHSRGARADGAANKAARVGGMGLERGKGPRENRWNPTP